MGSRAGLAAIEAIIDASGAAPRIEKMLPAGVRHRQLRARTLLTCGARLLDLAWAGSRVGIIAE